LRNKCDLVYFILQTNRKYPSDYIKVSISRSIPDYINNVVDIWDKRLSPSYCILKEYKSSSEGINEKNNM